VYLYSVDFIREVTAPLQNTKGAGLHRFGAQVRRDQLAFVCK